MLGNGSHSRLGFREGKIPDLWLRPLLLPLPSPQACVMAQSSRQDGSSGGQGLLIRAAAFDCTGGPEVLQPCLWSKPQAAEGRVLVRVGELGRRAPGKCGAGALSQRCTCTLMCKLTFPFRPDNCRSGGKRQPGGCKDSCRWAAGFEQARLLPAPVLAPRCLRCLHCLPGPGGWLARPRPTAVSHSLCPATCCDRLSPSPIQPLLVTSHSAPPLPRQAHTGPSPTSCGCPRCLFGAGPSPSACNRMPSFTPTA